MSVTKTPNNTSEDPHSPCPGVSLTINSSGSKSITELWLLPVVLQQGAHPSSDHRVQGLLAVSKYLLASATARKQAANSVCDGLLVSIKDEHGPEVQINLIFQLAIGTRQQGLGLPGVQKKGMQ